MTAILQFRAHHFLCTLGFIGKGYSPAFVENFKSIVNLLRSEQGGDVLIEVVAHTDTICGPCPQRKGLTCQTETKIAALDERHLAVLGLRIGEILTWEKALNLLADKMSLTAFEHACAGCQWKSLGVCKQALLKLSLK